MKCQNCGTPLADEQVHRAYEDANIVGVELVFLCSDYQPDTDTCLGNDFDSPAYWRTA